jgi:hypothetical protein
MKLMLTFILTIFITSPVFAGYPTVGELLAACGKSTDPKMSEAFNEANCLGYVGGAMDSAQVIFSIRPTSRLFCLPQQGVSPEQVLIHIQDWLEAYPAEADKTSGRMAILIGLAQAYPCK